MVKIKASRPAGGGRRRGRRRPSGEGPETGVGIWLFGRHAVLAALGNPRRSWLRLRTTREGADWLSSAAPAAAPEVVDRATLEQPLPPGAVHQGVALLARPLPAPEIEEAIDRASRQAVFVVLDQVTDPHNVGAILRSAAAFGAEAVVAPRRHAPPPTGTLAKAASGALEHVPLVTVTNLSRALEAMQQAGFWCVGLDAAADRTISEAPAEDRIALVLGAEGRGLRRLTAEHCDVLVRLPTGGSIGTLNVSNAAAVALYDLFCRRIPGDNKQGGGP